MQHFNRGYCVQIYVCLEKRWLQRHFLRRRFSLLFELYTNKHSQHVTKLQNLFVKEDQPNKKTFTQSLHSLMLLLCQYEKKNREIQGYSRVCKNYGTFKNLKTSFSNSGVLKKPHKTTRRWLNGLPLSAWVANSITVPFANETRRVADFLSAT